MKRVLEPLKLSSVTQKNQLLHLVFKHFKVGDKITSTMVYELGQKLRLDIEKTHYYHLISFLKLAEGCIDPGDSKNTFYILTRKLSKQTVDSLVQCGIVCQEEANKYFETESSIPEISDMSTALITYFASNTPKDKTLEDDVVEEINKIVTSIQNIQMKFRVKPDTPPPPPPTEIDILVSELNDSQKSKVIKFIKDYIL